MKLIISLFGHWRQWLGSRHKPATIGRILIVQKLLLGETLLLTPLLAKLRLNHPQAEIHMLLAPALMPLYATRPYGVIAHAIDMQSLSTIWPLLTGKAFDMAILPAENELSWLARAMGSQWTVAFDGALQQDKHHAIDEFRPFSLQDKTWGECVCDLVDGAAPTAFRRQDWPVPVAAPFELPQQPYVILHVGCSTPLKKWSAQRWHDLGNHFQQQGLNVVLTCGLHEQILLTEVDHRQKWIHFAGNLDLAQYWQLLAQATLWVGADCGISHLVRLVGTPSVVLYGAGNPALFGRGEFWRQHPETALFYAGLPCRDEQIIFQRRIDTEHCRRSVTDCPHPKCMDIISLDKVIAACRL